MNRLILIGNGFDLAHNLKTEYKSFIFWYLEKCLTAALTENRKNNSYVDELLTIGCADPMSNRLTHNVMSIIPRLLDYYNVNGLDHLFKDGMSFKITAKSKLFEDLILRCSKANWVDIENEFYDKLKEILNVEPPRRSSLLEKLNNDLEVIKKELEEYLSTIKCEKYSPSYAGVFNSAINLSDIVKSNLKVNSGPSESLILNFNYTSTVERYIKNSDIKINYIHGRINDIENKLIFGFGDELDEDYKKMELSKDNGFFEHIKSFGYFKTSNYHNLIRFIDRDEYQIYILGHSCGLSDRTMLNMIFEHTNCKSIKIFYHGTKEKNNYTRLTQEISRHFRDKVAMRNKIVPFDKSSPMAQVE